MLVAFDGGWPDAERVQPCFYPDWAEPEFTGVWVQADWNEKFVHAGHSDLLGSLMALGMERAFTGDIIVQNGRALVRALPELAVRLPVEWQKAGNTPIRVTIPEEPPVIDPPKGVSLRDTVPSLRLDCLLAAALRISRTKAADLIREGLVMVEHRPELRCDRQLEEGMLISVRHQGRIRLTAVGALTRKDRLPVELEVFLRA